MYNALGNILQQILFCSYNQLAILLKQALTAMVLILSRSWEQNYFYINFMWALCKHHMINQSERHSVGWCQTAKEWLPHVLCNPEWPVVGLGKTTTFRLNMYTCRNTNARWVSKALTHPQCTNLCRHFMYRTCGSHPTYALLYQKVTSNDTVYISVYSTYLALTTIYLRTDK